MNSKTVEQYWADFLSETGRDADTKYYDCFAFGAGEAMAQKLLALVLSGQKKATCSARAAYEAEGQRPPKPGDLSIVTDFAGAPRCVIETTAVTEMPFRDMTFEICKREGEDETLESWRKGHIKFFTLDAQAMGYAFSEDMPVVFEDFEMIYQ